MRTCQNKSNLWQKYITTVEDNVLLKACFVKKNKIIEFLLKKSLLFV